MPQVAISYQYGSCQDAIGCGTRGHCIDVIQEYLIQTHPKLLEFHAYGIYLVHC